MEVKIYDFTGYNNHIEFCMNNDGWNDYEAFIEYKIKYDKNYDTFDLKIIEIDATLINHFEETRMRVEISKEEKELIEQALLEKVDWHEYFEHQFDWQ